MKNQLITALAILTAFTCLLVLLSVTENYVTSKDVYFSEFSKDGIGYYGIALDGSNKIADLYFRVEHAQPNSNYQPMRVEWQHSPDVEIDSVTFRFRVASGTTIYMQTDYPGISSIPYSFSYKNQHGPVYEIVLKDIGSYGKSGSVRIDFIMRNIQNASQMTFEADFSMHYVSALQLSSIKAHAHLDALIPTDLPYPN
jgi:hypothetical protein